MVFAYCFVQNFDLGFCYYIIGFLLGRKKYFYKMNNFII